MNARVRPDSHLAEYSAPDVPFMHASKGAKAKANLWPLLGLFLSLYLLVFSGRLHSLDEYSSLAVARSLAFSGDLRTDEMAWAWAGDYSQDTFGSDGHLYSKKGLGVAIWAVPFCLAGRALGLGVAHAALLSSAVAAAIGATSMYWLGTFLSKSQRTGTLFSLLYGLGTIVFPYSKFLFSEALACTGMAVGLAGLAAALYGHSTDNGGVFPKRGQGRARLLKFSIAGLGLGISASARLLGVIALPLALISILWRQRQERAPWRHTLQAISCFLGPAVLVLLGLAGANWLRFGSPAYTGYAATETFSGVFWEGFRGLLFSPGKSLFLFSPPLLLAFVGLPSALRRWPELVLFSLGVASAHVLLYSAWYGWDGGWCWGPRFLVPIVPLLMLLALPVIQAATDGGTLAIAGVAIISIVSLLIQAGAVAVDFVRYYAYLVSRGIPTSLYYVPAYSQAIGHLVALNPMRLRWDLLDLAWVRPTATGPLVNWAGLGLGMAAAGFCLLYLVKARQRKRAWGLLCPIVALVASAASLHLYAGDPAYSDETGMLPALTRLDSSLRPGDVVVVELLPYLHFYAQAATFLNGYRGSAEVVMLLRQEPAPDATETRVLSAALRDARGVWLLLGATPIGHTASTTERWLSEHAYLARQVWVSPSSRASLFYPARPGALLAQGTGRLLEDGIALESYEIAASSMRGKNDGSVVLVDLAWVARARPTRRYTVFVQLIGPGGTPVSQIDAEPVSGLVPTDKWSEGQVVVDHYALAVPPGSTGCYQLIVGMYRPDTGQRLSAGRGDHLVLATLSLPWAQGPNVHPGSATPTSVCRSAVSG